MVKAKEIKAEKKGEQEKKGGEGRRGGVEKERKNEKKTRGDRNAGTEDEIPRNTESSRSCKLLHVQCPTHTAIWTSCPVSNTHRY